MLNAFLATGKALLRHRLPAARTVIIYTVSSPIEKGRTVTLSLSKGPPTLLRMQKNGAESFGICQVPPATVLLFFSGKV